MRCHTKVLPRTALRRRPLGVLACGPSPCLAGTCCFRCVGSNHRAGIHPCFCYCRRLLWLDFDGSLAAVLTPSFASFASTYLRYYVRASTRGCRHIRWGAARRRGDPSRCACSTTPTATSPGATWRWRTERRSHAHCRKSRFALDSLWARKPRNRVVVLEQESLVYLS